MTTLAIDRVALSWPTVIDVSAVSLNKSLSSTSWIQVVKTGTFVSSRYGTFSITRDELATMLRNFNTETPKTPTQLPVDYDHLSLAPKRPGDGVAAGWIRQLELRANGDELWAEVEWTDEGAKRIAAKEYRFVSPSFVKDYVSKNGQKIGTTLLAAAITNHPFLEGMAALTLYSMSAMGDLAISVDSTAISLMEAGQHVMVKPGCERLSSQRGLTFEIMEVAGEGDDGFASLQALDGTRHGWFRSRELAPARAAPPEAQEKTSLRTTADPGEGLMTLASTIVAQQGLAWRDAVVQASKQRPELAEEYRKQYNSSALSDERTPEAATTELITLANAIANERHISLSDAVKQAGRQRPDLADAHSAHSGICSPAQEARELADADEAGATLMELANRIVKQEGVSLRVALLKAQRGDPQSANRYFTLMTGR